MSSKRSNRNFNLRIFQLTKKNLKTMFRDKGQLAWIIGYPLIFMLVYVLVFGDVGQSSPYEVVVINNDIEGIKNPEDSTFANASLIFIDVLESKELKDYIKVVDEDEFPELEDPDDNDDLYDKAYELLRYEKIDAIIRIDKNFSEAIYGMGGKPKVKVNTINDEMTEGVIGSIVSQIVVQMQLNIAGVDPADIDTSKAEDSVELSLFDIFVPGFIIAGVMVCVSQLAAHFAEEKEKRTLERLTTTPVPKSNIILSALLAELVVIAFQVALMFFLSIVLFGAYVHPNANFLVMFMIPILFCFSLLGVGMIIAALAKTEGSAGGLAWLIILPMQFIGGVFSYGVETPGSQFIPTTYAVHALRLAWTNGIVTWDAIGVDIIFLSIFGIVTTIIGVLIFQKKTAVS